MLSCGARYFRVADSGNTYPRRALPGRICHVHSIQDRYYYTVCSPACSSCRMLEMGSYAPDDEQSA